MQKNLKILRSLKGNIFFNINNNSNNFSLNNYDSCYYLVIINHLNLFSLDILKYYEVFYNKKKSNISLFSYKEKYKFKINFFINSPIFFIK